MRVKPEKMNAAENSDCKLVTLPGIVWNQVPKRKVTELEVWAAMSESVERKRSRRSS